MEMKTFISLARMQEKKKGNTEGKDTTDKKRKKTWRNIQDSRS